MPVDCEIFPDLNLIVYVCTGYVTPLEFFNTGDIVAKDTRMKAGMMVIIDLFNGSLDFHMSDLNFAIGKYKETNQRGQGIGQTAVLTKSSALKYVGDTLRLLSTDSVTDFSIFHTEHDVLRWLGLPEPETLQRWMELRKKARDARQ